MAVEERDPLTGHATTGHDWNGIKELNTPVPRAIWWAIGITHVWALVMWVLLPTWPLGDTYTKGILGVNQKQLVAGQIEAGKRYREHWEAHLSLASLDEIRATPSLMDVVAATGPALWGDNCAVCHGLAGVGGPGYPNLVDGEWLWGGDDATVQETLRVGINAAHPETRFAQMPAFEGVLTRDQIRTVAAHVRSLSGLAPATAEGETLFVENCASCHGEDATGTDELGAPNLTDASWIYGSAPEVLFETIHDGRQGWMPAWEGRLEEAERKIITLYLLDVLAEAE